MIEACPTLSIEYDGPEYDDNVHPWLTHAHKQAHIAEVSEFLQKHAFQERDVTQVLNCKRINLTRLFLHILIAFKKRGKITLN